jgi:hypothetical protein
LGVIFLVDPKLSIEINLGLEFLKKNNAIIDISKNTIVINKNIINYTSNNNQGNNELEKILIDKAMTIQNINKHESKPKHPLITIMSWQKNNLSNEEKQNTTIREIKVDKEINNLYLKDEKILIPDQNKIDILHELHLYYSHPGGNKLYNTIKKYVYSSNLKTTCLKIATDCIDCQRAKKHRNNYGELKGYITAQKPWNVVSSDIVGSYDEHILIEHINSTS